jgi:hypothetical protein
MVQNTGTGIVTDGWTEGRISGRRMDGREVSRLTTALTIESSYREPKMETKKCKNLFFYDDIS